MAQPDFFNVNPDVPKEETLEEKFSRERLEWSQKIQEMSSEMKKVFNIPELMTNIYTERQRATEYYHYLISVMIKLNREYKKQYSERYDYWTFKAQIRYSNQGVLNNKIITELGDLVEKREAIENHSKFIQSTVSSIDNIIYGISKRVEIEQISRGK